MIFKATNPSSRIPNSVTVSLRCPECQQRGTFDAYDQVNDLFLPNPVVFLGQRRCPNPSCFAHIFFAYQSNQIAVSYPAERIDFDSTKVPTPVVAALEEAISCHATGCFVAAAIMVRKTLEALCRDRGAQGDNLKARIKALQTKVVLPQELLDGLDDLRLLGNDAAHIESHEYDKVGQEEVEVGIEFAKEVLKAVYQYSALLDRLRALKKNP